MPRAFFALPNSTKPVQGPTGVVVPFDFTAVNQISGDLGIEQMSSGIDYIQSIWIDNRLNAQPFVISFSGLLFTAQMPANAQGILPVVSAPGRLDFTAVSQGAGVVVQTVMMNIDRQPFIWRM